jgi:predicted 2-oxoglutarate/Fe(II)-dependent dioxygenase YbiX
MPYFHTEQTNGSLGVVMTVNLTCNNRVVLGEPVPWFSALQVSGGPFDLHVSAGRWVVLSFLGSPANPRVGEELNKLLQEAALFSEDHLVVACILTEPPLDAADLPKVDDSAGVPMFAPALMVPRVFSFELCDFLMQFYAEQGGTESGFQFDVDGKTTTLTDARFKRRSDVGVVTPEVRELVRNHIVRRLVPEIERYFQFQATRMDRYIVACYDSSVGGHFFRHRDNINAGAQHRRFAVSINLNSDFAGGDLMFPEFGRKLYRPPAGGALVFSCAALHQVTPVTSGRRFAFLAFLYGEEDARRREQNNSKLHTGEARYFGNQDRLFPEDVRAEAAGAHEAA